jgi:glycosyltransferase involved in cell wall biosynthesis
MRVCHVISGYYRTDARIFQRQCKSLVKNGFEVSILTNDGEKESIEDGITIYHCNKYWKNRFKVLFFAKYQFLKKALQIDAEIYQLHSPELIPLGLALKKMNKIVVYDAHEDLPRHILEKEWIPSVFQRPISLLVEAYMNRALRKYDVIVTPHSHVKEFLSKINPQTYLITNFPLINDTDNFSLNHYKSRESVMCYTGTVYRYSNQEVILNALDYIEGLKYEIAGHIDEQHLQQLKSYNSFSKVRFWGRIQWSEMTKFYSRCTLGIVVYDYKLNLGYKLGSFGTNKIFEYMQAGLPVICTDYDLWKEIISDFNCGICVEPQNSEQIMDAISFLTCNPEQAYIMGQNGRKAVLEKFNWNTQEKVYVDIFKKISKGQLN